MTDSNRGKKPVPESSREQDEVERISDLLNEISTEHDYVRTLIMELGMRCASVLGDRLR